jgi:membrane protein
MTFAKAKIQQLKSFQENLLHADLAKFPRSKRAFYRHLRILYSAAQGFQDNHCALHASALTYTTLLALVPLLALMFSILKGFGVQNRLEPILLEKLSAGSEEIVQQIIRYIDKTNVKALGAVGLAGLLLTAISLIGNIELALNRIWGVQRPRSLGRKFADYLSVLLTCPILFVAALGLTSSIQNVTVVQSMLDLPGMSYLALFLASLSPYLLMWIALTFIYNYLPNTNVRLVSALYGGVIAGTLWQLAQWGYIHFQVGVARYNAIYGAFAQLPIFLVWLYTGWNVVLFGAVLSFAHQNPRTEAKELSTPDADYSFKEELGLKLLWLIGKNFDEGKEPYSAEKLAQKLAAPVNLVSELLEQHCRAGFLLPATGEPEEPIYVLAKPPEKLRLDQVIEAMRHYGGDDGLKIKRVEGEETLHKTLERIAEARRKALSRITLRDLLSEGDA